MKIELTICEVCKKKAWDEKQQRREHWLQLHGGTLHGISIWLERPRRKGGVMMHTVGFKDRIYDFCSIKCLVEALNSKESI